MAIKKPERVTEEALIVVSDDRGNASTVVRRDPVNGAVQIFKLRPMRFGDMKDFLQGVGAASTREFIVTGVNHGIMELSRIGLSGVDGGGGASPISPAQN